jgi:hypothetical protein
MEIKDEILEVFQKKTKKPKIAKEPTKIEVPEGMELLSGDSALYGFIDRCFEIVLPALTWITGKYRPYDKTCWCRHLVGDSRTATLRGHRSHHRGDSTAHSLANDRQMPNR